MEKSANQNSQKAVTNVRCCSLISIILINLLIIILIIWYIVAQKVTMPEVEDSLFSIVGIILIFILVNFCAFLFYIILLRAAQNKIRTEFSSNKDYYFEKFEIGGKEGRVLEIVLKIIIIILGLPILYAIISGLVVGTNEQRWYLLGIVWSIFFLFFVFPGYKKTNKNKK